MQGGCLDAHPCSGTSIHAFAETSDGVRTEQSTTYIVGDCASVLHPGLGGWNSRCEHRIRRADHFAPNESSAAKMRAELLPEMCSGRMELSMPKSDSSRRADHFAPNESSVAQMRAELWPVT